MNSDDDVETALQPKTERRLRKDVYKEIEEVHANKETIVHLSKYIFLNSEVTLATNLQVKAIEADSSALHALLIGDQIVTICGHLVNSTTEVMEQMKKVDKVAELVVIRQGNRLPAPKSRLANSLSLDIKQFCVPEGYQYFIVALRKIEGAHLGLKVQQFRDKITITEVGRNSIAFYNFMVGDNILDLNCERVTQVDSFQELLRSSLKRYKTCTTLVERPDSETTLQKSHVLIVALSKDTNPNMASDVVKIGDREARRYSATLNMKRMLRPALLRHSSGNVRNKKKSKSPRRRRSRNRRSGRTRDEGEKKIAKKSPKKTRRTVRDGGVKEESDEVEESEDRVESRVKHISVVTRHTEENIATDAVNPNFLQKVPKHKPPITSMTFFTRIWKNS